MGYSLNSTMIPFILFIPCKTTGALMLETTYKHHFEYSDLSSIKECLNEHGFALVKQVLSNQILDALKTATLREAQKLKLNESWQSKTCLNFIEKAPEALLLLDHNPHMNIIKYLHNTDELCFHRSACIAREKGSSVVSWHTDLSQLKTGESPTSANEVLNNSTLDYNGFSAWYYLTGSRPSHGGLYVIENSHKPDWQLPEGFEFTNYKKSFRRIGDTEEGYQKFDIPGAIPIITDPGDLILFTKNTYHAANANQENEIRLSCGAIGFRPKRIKINAPWDWPKSTHDFKARLDQKYHHYLDGYTSIVPDWKPGIS
ncbi:MAG: hypothetical protein COA79_07315 [Planctomycetota bacterium]|nr:MAG: hypothetical protein COA79_07315 [Planctomycetota bacterium]